ncbi:MAG: glycosyltransferase family 10 [bacterium]|nr:glycosyltransferase family 10 [bacterium]
MDINNLNAGWFELKRQISLAGYELTTADDNNLKDCEGIIFFNANSIRKPIDFIEKIKNILKGLLRKKVILPYPTRDLYAEALRFGLKNKMILVIWEPKTVLSSNFDPKTWEKFDRILTWDDDLLLKNQKFNRFYVPMESNKVLEKAIPFQRKKLLVNMSHNKYSSYKCELYSARRNTSTYFDTHYPNDFDLFGNRWNKPVTLWQRLFPGTVKKYSTYRGNAKNKCETLSQYKFNLCYENTSDARGYVCDKIFTSFHVRSVPVYWGASNIEDYIDTDTFVDRRRFGNDKALAQFLTQMTEGEYNKYLIAAERFMQSDEYKKFLPENFGRTIVEALRLTKINT